MAVWWNSANSSIDLVWQSTGRFLPFQLEFPAGWRIEGWTQMAFLLALKRWSHASGRQSSLPQQTSAEPSGETLWETFLDLPLLFIRKTSQYLLRGTRDMRKWACAFFHTSYVFTFLGLLTSNFHCKILLYKTVLLQKTVKECFKCLFWGA